MFLPNKNIITARKNEPKNATIPVIFAIFKSKPKPKSQARCLISFKI